MIYQKEYITQASWHNKRFKSRKKQFFTDLGIDVNDLLIEHENDVSLNILQLKFNINTNHVTFSRLKHAMILDMRKCNIYINVCLNMPFIPIDIQIIVTTKKEQKLCMM